MVIAYSTAQPTGIKAVLCSLKRHWVGIEPFQSTTVLYGVVPILSFEAH
jgi:hypothetical protein